MDICHISGIFTLPVSGAWRVSYSLRSSVVSKKVNHAYLYMNRNQLTETLHDTYSESGLVLSTGGRVASCDSLEQEKLTQYSLLDGSLLNEPGLSPPHLPPPPAFSPDSESEVLVVPHSPD